MSRDATPTARLNVVSPLTTPTLVRAARQPTRPPAAKRAAHAVVTVLAPHERTRVDAAGEGCYTTVHRESIEEVLEDLRRCRADAVLLSVARCDARITPHVARMVREFPGVPAVALLSEPSPVAAQAVLALGQHGVRSLVDVRDIGGWHTLRQVLGTQHGEHIVRRAIERIERELPDAPEDLRRFLDGCFLAPPRVGTVRALARRLGVGSSTLMSRFFRAQVPAPKRFLAYARLVKAAALFENPGLSVTQVAHALEYSSPQSFGRHIQTMLDMTALRFRQVHDGASMLECFVADLIDPWRAVYREFRPLIVHPVWKREETRVPTTTVRRPDGALPGPRVMPRPGVSLLEMERREATRARESTAPLTSAASAHPVRRAESA